MDNKPNEKAPGKECNNSEAEALNRVEGAIKSLVYRDQEARESFRQGLRQRIAAKLNTPFFMKIFQAKVLAPLAVMVVILAAALVLSQSGFFRSSGDLANTSPKNEAINQTEGQDNKNEDIVANDSATESRSSFGFSLVKPVFASFDKVKNTVAASLPGNKADAAKLSNLKAFEENTLKGKPFSDEQKKMLDEKNFFLTDNFFVQSQESGADDFIDTYSRIAGSINPLDRSQENSVFITSDYALHLYHLLIDRSFQKIEEEKLQPRLKEMTQVLFTDSLNNYRAAKDEKIKDSYKRLAVFYLVPLSVLSADANQEAKQLNPEDFEDFAKFIEAQDAQTRNASAQKPDIISAFNFLADSDLRPSEKWIRDTSEQELKLIDKASEVTQSPLFSAYRAELKNDYTQFTPRSHYTKNAVLKTYFMSMMWYGRMGFAIKSPEQTRDALLMTGQINSLMVGDKKMSDLWSDTMALVDFFVGKTDDLTAYQYTEAAERVFGVKVSNEQLINDAKLDEFKKEVAKSFSGPRILSEVVESANIPGMTKEELLADTMQFRFMGQRFTPDAYVLNQLTQGDELPDPETGQKLPSMPTALMPVSVIAPENIITKSYLDAWVSEQAPDSDKVIAKNYARLVGEFNNMPEEQWNENIYWGWLDSYRPLLASYGQGYPFFMKGEDWQKKNLGTVLGSYTELKHDTLLYAKQSYAERGGGPGEGDAPPVVKGYVEPDPVFWDKILSLAKATRSGLTERGFMPESFSYRYDAFIDSVGFFKDFSDKELNNKNISDDDFEKLRVITSQKLAQIAEPLPGEELQLKDRRAGIIADIHTDALKGNILYEANAKPKLIFVAVTDVNGTRLTAGAVYNHYEFSGKLGGNRLADEDWQSIVYDGEGQLPTGDKWTNDLIK